MSETESKEAPRRTKVERGIYRRRDGHLEIGWRDTQGKQRWRAVDGGITAARAALAAEHTKRAKGERVAADPRLNFNSAADAWWDARVLKLRPATQVVYKAALKHLRESFGRARLTHITADDVARYITRKQAEGLKGWTLKSHMTTLSAVFTYAGRHLGTSAQNPVRLLDRVERPNNDDQKAKRILDGDDLARLLGAVDASYRLIFELAAETGCRLGETLGLVWENIDLDEQTVAFTHQLDRAGERVPLKTKGSQRILEVTPVLVAKLRKQKVSNVRTGDHDLVFVTRSGRGHDHRNIGGRVLAKAAKRAGLEAVKDASGKVVQPAPTFHDLRHSHASALIAQGWDIAEVSGRLGHSNVATTQRIYIHEFEAAKRSGERRERLSKLYGASSVEALAEAQDGSDGKPIGDDLPANVVQLQAASGI